MKKVLIFLLGFLLALGVLSAFPMRDDEPAKIDKKEDVTTTVPDDHETTDGDGDVTTDDPAGSVTSLLADEITASVKITDHVLVLSHDARLKEVSKITLTDGSSVKELTVATVSVSANLIEFLNKAGDYTLIVEMTFIDGSVLTLDGIDYTRPDTISFFVFNPDTENTSEYACLSGMTWFDFEESAFNKNDFITISGERDDGDDHYVFAFGENLYYQSNLCWGEDKIVADQEYCVGDY